MSGLHTEKQSPGPTPQASGTMKQTNESTAATGPAGQGLTSQEMQARLKQYGYNELPEKKQNLLLRFFSYVWGPIPWMIEIAAVLSLVVEHWADFWIILTLLLVNAIVGFWEEFQAGNTLAALKATLALAARVLRDGRWTSLPARELVPGDFIRLRLGDIIPADGKIQDDSTLEVDQSALTGESLPVKRSKGGDLYSGSIVRRGEADALVTATGIQTYMGKTARLVESAHTVSHFQKAVLRIGNYLIVIALVLVALILGVAISRGDKLLTTVQFVLILTVAAIPVAMPTVLSVTMAAGARQLARLKAIVSRLASVEELAGMDILCSDKTGTLTQNRLTAETPACAAGISPHDVLLAAALASREEDRDLIDLAILSTFGQKQTLQQYRILHFMPFDPVHKRTEATVQAADGANFTVTKGAPQVVLALDNTATDHAAMEQAVNDFAKRGSRSLGVARRDGDGPWKILGIIPLADPPREDSRQTIEAAEKMGVTVKMVTGDQVPIARQVATEVGLGDKILDADLLSDGKETPEHLVDAIEKADGFAQVFPEHKYRIVEALQSRGHIIGMTGDGVNDAPALKKADVGVAVSGATDAARSAADIVLLAPGLGVIINALRQSREIFKRMNSYAIYRIAETIRVLLFMTLSILIFNFYPVTAVMIVLLALLNDGAILSIAYDRAIAGSKPEAWNMKRVLGISTMLGLIGVVASFGVFYLGERVFHLDRAHIQTLIYLKLSVAGQLTIFITRTRGRFWSDRPATLLLCTTMGAQLFATLISVYGILVTPIGWKWALFVWGYALAWFIVNDQVKLLGYWALKRLNISNE